MSTIVTRAGKGSALSHTQVDSNFTNLNDDKLQNIVEDTTPQLGGDLDAQSNKITSLGTPTDTTDATTKAYVDGSTGAALPLTGGAMTGAITTNSTFDGVDVATRDGVLTTTTTTANAALPKTGGAMTGAITTNSTFDGVDVATRDAVLTSTTATANSALQDVVSDTSPQLGGDLDVNGQDIVSASNGDIELDPNGSGLVKFKGNATKGSGQFVLNCEANSHGITIKGPPHSAGADYTLTLPNNDGDADQVLTTDGSGVLTWTTASSGTVTGYTNGTDNRVITSSGTTTINGEANLTFDGSTLGLTGDFTVSGTVDGVDIATRDAVLTSTTTTANAALPKTGGAMTGAITTNSTFDGVDVATRDGVLTTTTTTANAALPKTGGAMTGAITTNSTFDGVDVATRDAVLTSTTTTANAALPKAGGTMTGAIAMGTDKITGLGDPTLAQDAATKAYADSIAGAVTSYTNSTDNRILTSGGGTIINGEANFTFDGSNALLSGSAGGLTSPVLEIETDNSGWNRPLIMLKDSNGDVASVGGEHNTGGDMYSYNFTLDPNNTHGRSGATTYAGDYFFGFAKNYSDQSEISMDMNVYGAHAGYNLTVLGDYNTNFSDRYTAKPINLRGNEVNLFSSDNTTPFGNFVKQLTVRADAVDIEANIKLDHAKALQFDNGGTVETTIDKDEITAKGSFKINVDSDNSGNELLVLQSKGTDILSFVRGPGGDGETTLAGDGFFIKDDNDKTQFSMDMSSASQTGINVFRTDENKSLSFTLKTDDDDDTGNFDGSWSFIQAADEKSLVLERVDGSAVEIFEIRDSAGVATAAPVDIFEFKIPPSVPSYAVGSLPTTVIAGAQALATGCNSSDVSTGTAMSFFDGTNWKYTHLPATTVRT